MFDDFENFHKLIPVLEEESYDKLAEESEEPPYAIIQEELRNQFEVTIDDNKPLSIIQQLYVVISEDLNSTVEISDKKWELTFLMPNQSDEEELKVSVEVFEKEKGVKYVVSADCLAGSQENFSKTW